MIPGDKAEEYEEVLAVREPRLNHAAGFTAACMGEDETRSPFRIGSDLTKTLMPRVTRIETGLPDTRA